MQREMRARLESLPRTQASFIEPMECLSVSKLPEGSQWIWEILCGGPHKISPCHASSKQNTKNKAAANKIFFKTETAHCHGFLAPATIAKID